MGAPAAAGAGGGALYKGGNRVCVFFSFWKAGWVV
jgi:hypothetical protein